MKLSGKVKLDGSEHVRGSITNSMHVLVSAQSLSLSLSLSLSNSAQSLSHLLCSLKLVTARNLSGFDSSLFKPINLRPTSHPISATTTISTD